MGRSVVALLVVVSSATLYSCGMVGLEVTSREDLAKAGDVDLEKPRPGLGLGGDGSVDPGAIDGGGSGAADGSGGTDAQGVGGSESTGGTGGSESSGGTGGSESSGGTGGGSEPDGSVGDDCLGPEDCLGNLVCSDGGVCERSPPSSIDDFSDTFDGSGLEETWLTEETGDCTVEEKSGKVQFTLNGAAATCSITTHDSFDMRGGYVDVDIPPITNYYSPLRVFFAIVDGDGNRIDLIFHDGQLEGRGTVANQVVFDDSASYESGTSYWRIRHQGNEIWLGTSTADVDWDVLMRSAVIVDLSAVQIIVGVEVTEKMDGSVSISVPGVNVAP